MRVAYLTAESSSKSQNGHIRTINSNNYKTLKMSVINSVRNL